MVETWVDSDALFPKKLWNHFKNPDERVNNNNESYNHRFNTKSGSCKHPNIWKFGELLKKEEYLLVQIRFARLKCGIIKSRGRNKSDVERDNVILKAKLKFCNSKRELENLEQLLEETTCAV